MEKTKAAAGMTPPRPFSRSKCKPAAPYPAGKHTLKYPSRSPDLCINARVKAFSVSQWPTFVDHARSANTVAAPFRIRTGFPILSTRPVGRIEHSNIYLIIDSILPIVKNVNDPNLYIYRAAGALSASS